MRRGASLVLSLALVVTACGGGSSTTTLDPDSREVLAAEYGASALRALEGTEFEELSIEEIAGLVLGACELVDTGASARSAAERVAGDLGATDGALLVEVVEIGIDDVCSVAPPTALDLIVAYEASVAAAVTVSGLDLPEDPAAVLSAGPVVCDALDTGSTAEQALLAAAGVLFGVTAPSIAELGESGRISGDDGILLGAVVASATAILCPEHRTTVEGFLEELEG